MINMLSSSRLVFILMLAPASSLVAETVTLRSNDQQEFKLDQKIAEQSDMLEARFKKDGIEKPVELENIDGTTLRTIIEILTKMPGNQTKAEIVDFVRRILPDSSAEVSPILRTVDYLQLKNPAVIDAVIHIFGKQIFEKDLENLSAEQETFEKYRDVLGDFPEELEKKIIERELRSVDRIFLDSSPNRRLNAREAIYDTDDPLLMAQVIAYISKYQTPSAEALPVPLQNVLKAWLGDKYASMIHFGPMPIEWARWPGKCPLPSDPNYNMYSDNTPEDRFVDNGDGTVTDVCTLLTWQQASTEPMNWQSAISYCAQLNDPEPTAKRRKTDEGSESKTSSFFWRAPTRIELQSIVNYASQDPALNSIFHEGNARYWSSTPQVGYENRAWTVNFETAQVWADNTARPFLMRCVRGERGGDLAAGAMKHYTAANNTVTDNFIGAVWQRRASDSTKIHADAKSYCTSGWTLPSVKALSTLVDVTRGSPRIDPGAFSGTPGIWFWSGSPRVGNPGLAWVVDFGNGLVNDALIAYDYRVRCVRWE